MRVIVRRRLREFWKRHRDGEGALKAWFAEAQAVDWKNPQGIKRRYKHASFMADNRVVFSIKGNKYRLVTHVNYDFGIVYIKFIGTHAEYDRIDPGTI